MGITAFCNGLSIKAIIWLTQPKNIQQGTSAHWKIIRVQLLHNLMTGTTSKPNHRQKSPDFNWSIWLRHSFLVMSMLYIFVTNVCKLDCSTSLNFSETISIPRYPKSNQHERTYRPKMSSEVFPAGNYIFKVNNRNTRAKVGNMLKVNNKVTKTTPGVVLVALLTLNIFHTFVLVFLLLTLSR